MTPQDHDFHTAPEQEPSEADKLNVMEKLVDFNDSQAVSEGMRD